MRADLLRSRLPILFAAGIVLAVYLPSLFAPFCVVDDVEVFEAQRTWTGWSLREVFFPHSQTLLYYRPILGLSQVFDRFFWDLDPFWMHAENVLLHVVNVFLVHLVAKKLCELLGITAALVAPISALVFGLHPLATESVNWISGRTDILASLFVLTSCYLLLLYRQQRSFPVLLLALVAAIAGVLSKESAIAFFPGGLLILAARNPQLSHVVNRSVSRLQTILVAVFFAGGVGVFSFFRHAAGESTYGRIGMTLKFIFNDLGDTLFICLRALGFYVKKIFLPWPVNFAIVEVDPVYELLGIVLLPILFYLLVRRSLLGAIFLSGLFTILPSFVMAFNQIAWTPYAERYLYMGMALIIPVVSVVHLTFWRQCSNAHFVPQAITVAVIVLFLGTTFQRNLIWQDNLSLVQDTAEKSPFFKEIQLIYGNMLAEKGDYALALQKLTETSEMLSFGYDERPDLSIVDLLEKQKDYPGAVRQCLHTFKRSKGRSFAAVDKLLALLTGEQYATVSDIIEIEGQLVIMDPQAEFPLTSYLQARLALLIGKSDKAQQMIVEASIESKLPNLPLQGRAELKRRFLALSSTLDSGE